MTFNLCNYFRHTDGKITVKSFLETVYCDFIPNGILIFILLVFIHLVGLIIIDCAGFTVPFWAPVIIGCAVIIAAAYVMDFLIDRPKIGRAIVILDIIIGSLMLIYSTNQFILMLATVTVGTSVSIMIMKLTEMLNDSINCGWISSILETKIYQCKRKEDE